MTIISTYGQNFAFFKLFSRYINIFSIVIVYARTYNFSLQSARFQFNSRNMMLRPGTTLNILQRISCMLSAVCFQLQL